MKDQSLYDSNIDIEDTLGLPLNVNMKFQLNIPIIRDTNIEMTSKLQKNLTVVPIMWFNNGFDSFPNPILLDVLVLMPKLVSGTFIGLTLFLSVMFLKTKNQATHEMSDVVEPLNP